MKCQTCVRARLRHLTWPINLGLIGLCHNKTEIQIQMQPRYTTSDIDVHSLLILPRFFLYFLLESADGAGGSSKFVIFTDGQVIDMRWSLAKSGGSGSVFALFLFCGILACRHFIRFFNCVKHFWILHVRNSKTPKLVKILLSQCVG